MVDNKISRKSLSKLIIVLVLLVAVIIVLSVTFAWLRIGLVASNNNVIRAGLLDLRVDESPTNGAEVRIEKAIPQSYRQGITNKPYKFTLINNSTIDTDYTISLEDYYVDDDENLTTSDKIEDSLIRYILVKNGDEVIASNSKLLSTGRAIDIGTISGKTSVDPVEIPYTLYIWIDSMAGEDGTESNLMSKVFNSRLAITAEQHHTTENNNQNNEEPSTPVQTGFHPIYFAFGNVTTSSGTSYPEGHNVFAALDSQENKGICLVKGTVSCFQAGVSTIEYENTHLQQVFEGSSSPCDIGNDYISCHTNELNCDFDSYGNLRCDDYISFEHCNVNSDGSIECM